MKAEPVLFLRPGDLHLVDRSSASVEVAGWMIEESNDLIRPDFVHFAGDNVQDAEPEQFELFLELAKGLEAKWKAMPGDHDVVEDPTASRYQKYVGRTYDSFDLKGFRFIQLNTCESKPVGFSDEQLDWFSEKLESAVKLGLRVIVFQHHYPFKVCESFAGPGVERWRELTRTSPIEAILCGHTHYGQKANDGLNLSVATRSIGDPEGGSSGYHIFYADERSLACVYREHGSKGPAVLITSPRELIFCRTGEEVVSKKLEVEVLVWSQSEVEVKAWIDQNKEFSLERRSSGDTGLRSAWSAKVDPSTLKKGVHQLQVIATDKDGDKSLSSIKFIYDPTGRYTALPMLEPAVELTEYC